MSSCYDHLPRLRMVLFGLVCFFNISINEIYSGQNQTKVKYFIKPVNVENDTD